jgi:hypothetical protein
MSDNLQFLLFVLGVIVMLAGVRRLHIIDLIDSDSRLIRKGNVISGRVTRISTVPGDSESYTLYVIGYEYIDPTGKRQVNSKVVRDPRELQENSYVQVYYLPDRPEKNTIGRMF